MSIGKFTITDEIGVNIKRYSYLRTGMFDNEIRTHYISSEGGEYTTKIGATKCNYECWELFTKLNDISILKNLGYTLPMSNIWEDVERWHLQNII